MSGNVLEVSDETFAQEVEKSDLPVLVDFWAPWCGPCKAISPTLEALSEEYKGKVKFVKVNVDDNQESAQKFAVSSIPFLLLFKGGVPVDNNVGVASKAKLQNMILGHI